MAVDWKQHGPVIDLLDEFYCWKSTLKEYLQYVFMTYNIDQEKQDDILRVNDIKYVELLEETIIACNCSVPVVPGRLDLFSVYGTQTDLLYKIIENRCKNSRPEEHVISLGNSLAGHDSKNGHMINSFIVQCDYPNSMFTVLSLHVWKLLMEKIGCDLMFYILDRMSLFSKMPKGCLVQICGKIVPILEPKAPGHSCKLKLSTVTSSAEVRKSQQSVQLHPNRLKAKRAEYSTEKAKANRHCLRFAQLTSQKNEMFEVCTSTSKCPQKRSFGKAFNEPLSFEYCSEENTSVPSLCSKVKRCTKRRRVDARNLQAATTSEAEEQWRSNGCMENCKEYFISKSGSQKDIVTKTVQEMYQCNKKSCMIGAESYGLLKMDNDIRNGCYLQESKKKNNHYINDDAFDDINNEELSPVYPVYHWKDMERDSSRLDVGANKGKFQKDLDPQEPTCQSSLENPPLHRNSNIIDSFERGLSQGSIDFTMISSRSYLMGDKKVIGGSKEEKEFNVLTNPNNENCMDAPKLTVAKSGNATVVKEISEDMEKETVDGQINSQNQDQCKDGPDFGGSILDMVQKSRKRNKFRKHKPLRAATKEEHVFKLMKIMYSSRVTERLAKAHVLNCVPASKKGANILVGKIFNLEARFKNTENNQGRGNNPTTGSSQGKVPKNLSRILTLLLSFLKKFKKLKVRGILELECPLSPTVDKLHKSYRLKRKKQWVQRSRFDSRQRLLFRAAILDYVPPYQVSTFIYLFCSISHSYGNFC